MGSTVQRVEHEDIIQALCEDPTGWATLHDLAVRMQLREDDVQGLLDAAMRDGIVRERPANYASSKPSWTTYQLVDPKQLDEA